MSPYNFKKSAINCSNLNLKNKAYLNPFKGYFNPVQDILVLEMNNSYIGITVKIVLLNSTRKSILKEYSVIF
jgi:hypothetical protein